MMKEDIKEDKSKRHHQKSKHKSKKKKHKKKKDVSSGSSDSDCEMEWIEAPASKKVPQNEGAETSQRKQQSNSPSAESSSSNAAKALASDANLKLEKRDDWMNEESFVPTLSKRELFCGSSQQKKKEAAREQREKDQAIQEARELNPYMKNKGKGLPEEATAAEHLQLPSSSVGDGGYSFLKKAYLRIQEQAQEQGRSMEEVAVERWGSLDKLVSMIEEAESRMKIHSKSRYGSRIHREREEFEFRRSSKPDKFKRPTDEVSPKRSPERSFKYRKPTEDRRHHHSQLNFSSKSQRKYERNSGDEYNSKERHSHTKHDSDRECLFGSETASRFNQYSSKLEDKRESDIFDSSSYVKSKSPLLEERRKESHSRIPAWKKPKFVEESRKVTKPPSPQFSDPKNFDHSVAASSDESAYDEKPNQEDSSKMNKPPKFYTSDDLSKLAAKVFKAELMGDMTLAATLKIELDNARELLNDEVPRQSSKRKEEVILMKRDSSGQTQPLKITDQDQISSHSSQKGRKNKYFDDGSKYSLKQMFEREKFTTADDNLEMFMEVASECKEATDIDYDMDDVAKKVSQKMSHNRQEEKDIGKAIKQHQKRQSALEKCIYCLDQPNMKHHLIVDIGDQIYLSLPNYQSLTEGHCLIVPKAHISSFLCLDEDEWREVQDYKKNLRNMFRLESKTVIFLETSMNFQNCPHAVLECIPVPEEDGDMAPMYFKKAILESEAEWANNVKLVDLTKKGLQYSVPRSLPYFAVEFDPEIHAGFAHVIEEEKYFPRNFGKEVVGGMLDIDYNYLYKNKREDPLKKSSEVLQFSKKWKTFKDS